MSEHEGGESRSMGAFLLGFLTGVLVCAGTGGAWFLVVRQQSAMEMHEALLMAEHARAEAEDARHRADAERKRAEEAAKRAREALEKAKKGP
jgi:hypothetical protein